MNEIKRSEELEKERTKEGAAMLRQRYTLSPHLIINYIPITIMWFHFITIGIGMGQFIEYTALNYWNILPLG